jgi:hypothetical protein
MSILNFLTIIPIPIHSNGNGGTIVWGKVVILMIVSFCVVVLPFLIYIIKEYIKHKREYPMLSFDFANYPLSTVILGVYIVLIGVIFICWMTNFIYGLTL